MSSRSNGRDEGVLEPAGHLLVDLVATLLERLDARHVGIEVVVLVDHHVEGRRGCGEIVAVGGEQLEEPGVLGQEMEAHRDPSSRLWHIVAG